MTNGGEASTLLDNVAKPVLISAVILLFFQAQAVIFIWIERKVMARIQDRLGPTRVGGKFGWLQTLADGVKLLLKEDLIPEAADRLLFRMAPYIVLVGSFLAFLVVPFSWNWVTQELNIAVFFMIAVMSVEVFGVIMAGYASGSKWSLYGAMREAAQMVSYEVPMAVCIVVSVMASGTMNMIDAGRMQSGWFWNWHCFHDPFTFFAAIAYFVCAMAHVKRAPFDLAEAESELVAGFHTEYSGFRFMIFFMAEYASMLAVSWIAVTMFWGGWSGPLPISRWLGLGFWEGGRWTPSFGGKLLGFLNFIAKGYFLVLLMIWVRWTLPRIRIDQVMTVCLKYLLPLSCFLLLGAAAWPLIIPTRAGGLIGSSAAALAVLVVLGIGIGTAPPNAAHGTSQSSGAGQNA